MALVEEHHVEQQALDWLQELGYERKRATDLSSKYNPERADYCSVVLKERLQSALTRFNPDLPPEAINTALVQLIRPDHPSLTACNRQLHQPLTKGVTVTVHQDHQEFGKQLKVIDFDNPQNNDWLVVDQMIVQGSKRTRQPDLVIFVNGLPLAVIELKNPADTQTDIWKAYQQLQAYKEDIPDLFNYNVCLAISDGIQARVGSLTASEERFMRWRTIDGREPDPLGLYQELQTLIKGLFQKEVFLNYLRFFCLFEEDKEITKKIAGYHQYHAVQAALESIVAASKTNGSKKGGVIWHTQGAGKSLEMACLAGRLISDPRLENPTILMVTDRQNLDGQLFSVFAHARDFLGETPQQVTSRAELRACLMNRPSGGILFTTIQKFAVEKGEDRFPLLTPRHNIVVIADEAHRTQYGFKGTLDSQSGEIKYGLAKALREALPNATFLAFTGTPLSQTDRDTQAVFGDYISIYDLQQAVQDGATVPIYYESRLAKVNLRQEDLASLDEEIEDILESDDTDERVKEKVKSRWATLETIVGTDSRLQDVAEDMIRHYETRQQTQRGKAMIVAMSRNIAVRLYNKITLLRPHWHSDSLMSGTIKVVMTTSAGDHPALQRHHTTSSEKKDLEKRFKDPEDALQIVIVRDMWLTGFDAPCLSTLYIDKPMQGANLVQAIARVNRVFQDKPGGLVVDYMGIAPQLKEALNTYSASQGKGRQIIDVSEALRLLKEKMQVARDLLHPFDWSHYRTEALSLIPPCLEHILQKEEGKKRYGDTVLQMTKAFSLCRTLEETLFLSAEVAFHQALRAPLIKSHEGDTPQRGRKC